MRRLVAGGALLVAIVSLSACGGGAPARTLVTLAPTAAASLTALATDARVIATRLGVLGDGADTAIVEHRDVVVEGNRSVSDSAALVQTGRLLFRPVLCGAPAADTDAAPPPTPLPPCGARYATNPANLSVEPESNATNGYVSDAVPPDPRFAFFRSTPAAGDDAGRTVLLPGAPAAGEQQYDRFVLGPSQLSGSAVASASAGYDNSVDGWVVLFTLTPAGARRWDRVAGENFHLYVGIELDGQVLSAPIIQPTQSSFTSFQGKGEIAGSFDRASATGLAAVLASGPLAAPLRVSR